MRNKIIAFIKKETVLTAATLLAVVSAFIVPPSADYLGYIDWRVLGILLSLMTVMTGLQRSGVFDMVGDKLLRCTRHVTGLLFALIFLCFFFSMLITNDVALLTFVPLTVVVLKKCEQEEMMIFTIVMQTIAANLGSMLTPIGNPQNLYLYNLMGVGIFEFMGYMLPYTLVCALLLAIAAALMGVRGKGREIRIQGGEAMAVDGRKSLIYGILFFLCLLVVVRVLPFYLVLAVVLAAAFIMDRQVLKQVDYSLLLTFIAFFVFTGNIGNLPVFRTALENLVSGRELLVGILASQIISNVPAALLLSDFSTDYVALLMGVNLGGLGTLIASMASLISYKIYAQSYGEAKGRYFMFFTVANLAFLGILLLVAI